MTETHQQAAERLTAGTGKLVKVYDYRNGDGSLSFCNLRIMQSDGKKTFRMMAEVDGSFALRRPEEMKPEKGWPLYGLASLSSGGPVFVVEGEKDVDSLHALGLQAVTSGSTSSTSNADWTPLRGREVALWPDNDEAGRRYMGEVKTALEAIGCNVETVKTDTLGLPEKGDCSDWLALHPAAGAAEVLALIPKPDTTAELLDACRRWIHRYCIVSRTQGITLAAWVLHTWAIDAADFTPYIHITAPEKGCGKTQLLETLGKIVRKPWLTAGASAAVIYRKVDAEHPTLLLDETDAAFGGSDEYAEALRGVLNAGFKRTGSISRCEGKGADMKLKDFNCYSPKAIAGIGKIPDTVASRSIVVSMQRKKKGETVERFRERAVEALAKPLRERLEKWARHSLPTLKDALPVMPDQMRDRQQDITEALIAIADLAGGDWPEDVRASLMELFSAGASEDGSYRVRLLKDIQAVFGDRKVDRIASVELCSDLVEMDGQPWRDWNKGKGMDSGSLAKLLREFSIHSGTMRIGSITLKGYLKSQFEDAWSRYCPSPSPRSRNAVTTRINTGDLHDFVPSQDEACYLSENDENPHEYRVVTAVTATKARGEQNGENETLRPLTDELADVALPGKVVF